MLEGAKQKAKNSGLWNFFLPDTETGEGLKNLDYAYIAAELGRYPLSSETLNCSAPDTGNMEVLERVGTPEQKEKWLKPLLAGEIRSAYAEARVYVSGVKTIVPEITCRIIDQAIQMHGATGVSQWTPLADIYTTQRTLRLGDGPDEVHHMVVGRNEVQKYGLWYVAGLRKCSDDTPIATSYAWARAFRIGDGPDEVHLRQIYGMEQQPEGELADSPYILPPM